VVVKELLVVVVVVEVVVVKRDGVELSWVNEGGGERRMRV